LNSFAADPESGTILVPDLSQGTVLTTGEMFPQRRLSEGNVSETLRLVDKFVSDAETFGSSFESLPSYWRVYPDCRVHHDRSGLLLVNDKKNRWFAFNKIDGKIAEVEVGLSSVDDESPRSMQSVRIIDGQIVTQGYEFHIGWFPYDNVDEIEAFENSLRIFFKSPLKSTSFRQLVLKLGALILNKQYQRDLQDIIVKPRQDESWEEIDLQEIMEGRMERDLALDYVSPSLQETIFELLVFCEGNTYFRLPRSSQGDPLMPLAPELIRLLWRGTVA
jgi:hypothetical protein